MNISLITYIINLKFLLFTSWVLLKGKVSQIIYSGLTFDFVKNVLTCKFLQFIKRIWGSNPRPEALQVDAPTV